MHDTSKVVLGRLVPRNVARSKVAFALLNPGSPVRETSTTDGFAYLCNYVREFIGLHARSISAVLHRRTHLGTTARIAA